MQCQVKQALGRLWHERLLLAPAKQKRKTRALEMNPTNSQIDAAVHKMLTVYGNKHEWGIRNE